MRGLYVHWPDCHLSPGDGVSVRVGSGPDSLPLFARVVRVDPGAGVGLTFSGLGRPERGRLRDRIRMFADGPAQKREAEDGATPDG